MEDSNVEPDEWWELIAIQFNEEMIKTLVVHKNDGDKYIQHLSIFKKAFPNFLYMSLDNSQPSNLVNETHEA